MACAQGCHAANSSHTRAHSAHAHRHCAIHAHTHARTSVCKHTHERRVHTDTQPRTCTCTSTNARAHAHTHMCTTRTCTSTQNLATCPFQTHAYGNASTSSALVKHEHERVYNDANAYTKCKRRHKGWIIDDAQDLQACAVADRLRQGRDAGAAHVPAAYVTTKITPYAAFACACACIHACACARVHA